MIILWNRGAAVAVSSYRQHRHYAFVQVFVVPAGGGGGSAVMPLAYYRKLLLGG